MGYTGLQGTRPYAGAAWHYARYRDHVAPEFFAMLAADLGWTRGDRILDLGAGPAQLSIPIAALVGHVVAVDPEPDMLDEGRRRVEAAGATNITFLQGRGEDLGELAADLGARTTCVMGASFHWMTDKDGVLAALGELLDAERGSVCFVTPFRTATPDELRAILDRVHTLVEEFAGSPEGPHPRARHDPFEDILRRSPFPVVERLERNFEMVIRPTAEDLCGFEYTLSHTLARLGSSKAAFEGRVCNEFGTGVLGEFVLSRRDEALIGRRGL